jgi:Tol biopolymer transport system component
MPLRILMAALAILLVPAAAASADSIVYVKDGNVWVAAPDGSSQRQLTRDGTADHPYRSPSQADDGTVAASYLDGIRLISRAGKLVRELDPPPLTNSVSHAMDGTPVDVAISPDGKTIAYTFVSASCPVGASCGARAATGYVTSTGGPLPGNLYLSNPSWVGNSRTLVFGGYLHQVNTHDLGAAEDVHWFDDYEVVGQENATDLGDGELSLQGDKLALVRGYGGDTHIMWYTTNGSGLPTMQCATGKLEGLHGPTWAPDGQSLAWGEPDGVWIKPSALDCTVQPSLVIPGGSEPDWGPANAGAPARPVMKARAARGRITVSVPCATACSVRAKLVRRGRTIASKRVTLGGPGTAKLSLKPKRLKRGAKVTVRATVTLADGAATTLQKRVSSR